MLDDQLAYLYSHVTSSYGRPTEGAYQRYQDLVDVTDPYLERINLGQGTFEDTKGRRTSKGASSNH